MFGDTAHAVLDPTGRSLLDAEQSSLSYPRNQPGVIDTAAAGPGDTVLVAGRSVDDDPFVMRLRANGNSTHASASAGSPSSRDPGHPGGIIEDRVDDCCWAERPTVARSWNV